MTVLVLLFYINDLILNFIIYHLCSSPVKAQKMNQYSDPDELFSKSPNVLKFNEANTTETATEIKIKENKLVKTKKSVPSNITCHCAGKRAILYVSI